MLKAMGLWASGDCQLTHREARCRTPLEPELPSTASASLFLYKSDHQSLQGRYRAVHKAVVRTFSKLFPECLSRISVPYVGLHGAPGETLCMRFPQLVRARVLL